MITAEISKWIALVLAITAIVFLVKAGMKIFNILVMAAVLAFCWFTFFTEVGAARLSIALVGKPITAYTTKLEKQNDISTNVSYLRNAVGNATDGADKYTLFGRITRVVNGIDTINTKLDTINTNVNTIDSNIDSIIEFLRTNYGYTN